MDLCNSDHDEVCFDGSNCPVCVLQGEYDQLKSEAENFESSLEEAQNDRDEFAEQLEKAEEEVKDTQSELSGALNTISGLEKRVEIQKDMIEKMDLQIREE